MGRLSETISPGTQETPAGQHVRYAYEPIRSNNRGLLKDLTYSLDGTDYVVSFDYDDLGRTDVVHYPTNGGGATVAIKSVYDSSGGVLTGLDDVGSGSHLWRVDDVYQGHLIQHETFGNGEQTTYGYHPTRRWLENIQTTLGNESIQALEYSHYNNGSVHTLDTPGLDRREYVYDNLNRLSFVNTLGQVPTAIPYTYDTIGNLTGQGATVNTYRVGQPHLLDQVGDNSYLYDFNGNVSERSGPDISGGSQTFTYTPFDLPRSITNGGGTGSDPLLNTVRFDYSADEERVVRRDPDSVRYFVNDFYQRKADNFGTTLEERFRFYAGSRQIGEVVRKDGSQRTLYFHTDHLGSTTTVSDSDGGATQQSFSPFGALLASVDPELTRVGFTGQDEDLDLGLIDMHGRIYDPLAGRFTTPDPVIQAPFWSQGLNLYSYSFNDPINNADPSGFDVTQPIFPSNWDGQNQVNAGLAAETALAAGAFIAETISQTGGAPGAGAVGTIANLGITIGNAIRGAGGMASVTQSITPTTAPGGTQGREGLQAGAQNTRSRNELVIPTGMRRSSACDVGMCLAQSTPAGEGAPGFDIRTDGTGGGVPVAQTSKMLDYLMNFVSSEVSLVVNIIIFVEEQRRALAVSMVPAPKDLQAFPGARRVSPKTSVQGGGGLRKRWKDADGGIYEWDSQHGAVERYDRRGKHLGEFDPETGEQTKPPDPTRRVNP